MYTLNIAWKKHILSKYTFVHHQHWMKWNTFYQNTLLYPINIGWKENWMKSINIGWKASILDEKKHILSKYKFVHLQHWMKGNTFYQNTLLYPINIGWKASILDEKHQYWMKSIDIGWRETHFIKIQICTPILDEKNTFYQNIHLFTFNIGWKETHFYQNTQLHAFNIASKETYFIKIPICILPILDEKHQYWMKRNTFYQNTNLYSNIGWKEHILSKYTFVLHQYWMKRTHFIKIYICTPSILHEKKNIFIKIQICTSISDEIEHILSKYAFVHLQHWMKGNTFLSRYTILCLQYWMKWNILSKYTFVSHQYWMKSINIGWKETHFIKIQICTPWILDEKNTFYQNIHLYTFNNGWKGHILWKYTFGSHQYWMKSINIGWKETHFIKIQICTPWILHEKNTFYQNIHLYTINIGWKETHFIKIHFCILSILDEKHQYWIKYWMKSINIGWKETHFIKIYICTPSTLDETHFIKKHILSFYQNTLLYPINIGWKASILDEKKHILLKYKFVHLEYCMKKTHFIKIYICTPSTLDEMKHILSKYTFVSYQYWMKSINIGWKASILDEKKHILSKYKFVHLQHWMKGNTFYQNTLLYPINIGWKASILDEKHQYWMKSIDIGWKETHFIKIQICTPILDEKNTFYQNIHLFTFNIGWKETHFIKIQIMPSILHETYFIKIPICILPILDEKHQYWMKRNTFYQNTNLYSNIGWKEHILSKYTFVHLEYYMKKNILSKYKFVSNIRWKEHILSIHHQHWMKGNTFLSRYTILCLQYWMKRNILSKYTFVSHQYWMKSINIGWKETHFIKIQICTPWILDEKNTFYQNIHLYTFNIGWKGTHFIKIHFWIPSILDEKHQYWMKRNTFYQNTNLYSNIGWKEHILSKSTFVHLQHWMKGNTFYQNTLLYPINIGWKASYWMNIGNTFYKIQICTPWILHEKNTFYQNIHLYTINIGWNETHFIKIHFCILSILDEKHQYWMKSIDIGWKETHFIKI